MAGAAGTAALAACAAPAPQVVEKVVTQEVETQVEVTREVEVQVEKEVMVTAAVSAETVNIRYSSVGWGGWLSEPWMQVVQNFNESQSAIQIPGGYEDVAEGYQKVMAQAAGGVAADVYLFETKYMQGPPLWASSSRWTNWQPQTSKQTSTSRGLKEMFWAG
jgi:ABC-type glycerol-3-phosphate transport system substrate-binding protein